VRYVTSFFEFCRQQCVVQIEAAVHSDPRVRLVRMEGQPAAQEAASGGAAVSVGIRPLQSDACVSERIEVRSLRLLSRQLALRCQQAAGEPKIIPAGIVACRTRQRVATQISGDGGAEASELCLHAPMMNSMLGAGPAATRPVSDSSSSASAGGGGIAPSGGSSAPARAAGRRAALRRVACAMYAVGAAAALLYAGIV
jgi:hypothetical protein